MRKRYIQETFYRELNSFSASHSAAQFNFFYVKKRPTYKILCMKKKDLQKRLIKKTDDPIALHLCAHLLHVLMSGFVKKETYM